MSRRKTGRREGGKKGRRKERNEGGKKGVREGREGKKEKERQVSFHTNPWMGMWAMGPGNHPQQGLLAFITLR